MNPAGFGFVDAGDDISVFVPPPLLGGFVDADVVTVVPFGPPERLTADSVELVERRRTVVAGVLELRGSARRVVPDPFLAHDLWAVDVDAVDAADGDLVVGELVDDTLVASHVVTGSDRHGVLRARVMARNELPFDQPPSHRVAPLVALAAGSARRDLTSMVTLTIDADRSTDLDDALSVFAADASGTVRVLVHISDVAEHVPAGSPADVDAALRATSLYLPGGHRPMFDPSVSSEALSLLPGVERDTLTVELCVDTAGEVTAADVFESRIRSDLRLSYDLAADVIAHRDLDLGGRVATGVADDEVVDALRWLRTASARLSSARARRGGMPARRVDPELEFDSSGVPLAFAAQGASAADSDAAAAHDLIETLMVAANEAVAGWLEARRLPGIFRVHGGPDADAAEVLEQFCRSCGVAAGLAGDLSPRALAALDAQFAVIDDPALVSAWELMFSPPASYSARPGEHFGLASTAYVHFTSPIRRYADLCVHRVVKAYLAGVRDFAADAERLEAVAAAVTEASGAAARGESQLRRAMWLSVFADLHADQPDVALSARVTAVRAKGVRVVVDGSSCWAFLRFADLPGRWDQVGPAVAESSDGDRLAVGDPLDVTIAKVDETTSTFEVRRVRRGRR